MNLFQTSSAVETDNYNPARRYASAISHQEAVTRAMRILKRMDADVQSVLEANIAQAALDSIKRGDPHRTVASWIEARHRILDKLEDRGAIKRAPDGMIVVGRKEALKLAELLKKRAN